VTKVVEALACVRYVEAADAVVRYEASDAIVAKVFVAYAFDTSPYDAAIVEVPTYSRPLGDVLDATRNVLAVPVAIPAIVEEDVKYARNVDVELADTLLLKLIQSVDVSAPLFDALAEGILIVSVCDVVEILKSFPAVPVAILLRARKVVDAFACVRNVVVTQLVVDDIVELAYANVGKVALTQAEVEANDVEAFACVRNVAVAQAVVEDIVLDAYAKLGKVPEAYEFVT
jgi:hypothetical protein